MTHYILSRISESDSRDLPLSEILKEVPNITEKYWWDNGWWGDQGSTSECTAYSWTHWVEDHIQNEELFAKTAGPLWDVNKFYEKLKLNDGIPGTNYQGSTIRAGAKVLKELGIITEYRWAASVDEMIQCLLTVGPMVVGTAWYRDMFTPNPQHSYIIKPTGVSAGGHAYVINGVSKDRKLFRIKNSWGQNWGDHGHAYISFDDFSKLLSNGGDACIALNSKLDQIPDINSIVDNDIA